MQPNTELCGSVLIFNHLMTILRNNSSYLKEALRHINKNTYTVRHGLFNSRPT